MLGPEHLPALLREFEEVFAMFAREDERMKAIGLISLGFTGGAALGPILGGVLLEAFSWHSVFLVNVPAMIAVIAVVPRVVPEFANPAGARVDLRSAICSAVIMGVIAVLIWTQLAARPQRGLALWGRPRARSARCVVRGVASER